MTLLESDFLMQCKVQIGKHCRVNMPFRLEKYRNQTVSEQEILELFPEICQLATLQPLLREYNITLKSYVHQGCYSALELYKMDVIARWAVKHRRRVSDLYMIQHFPGRNVSALYKFISVQIKRVQEEVNYKQEKSELDQIHQQMELKRIQEEVNQKNVMDIRFDLPGFFI